MKNIGFIGASGLMGHGMARSLLVAKGFPLSLAVHRKSLALASAMGQGKRFVPALVLTQEPITGAKIAPK